MQKALVAGFTRFWDRGRRAVASERRYYIFAASAIVAVIGGLLVVGPVIRWIIANRLSILIAVSLAIILRIAIYFARIIAEEKRDQEALIAQQKAEAQAAQWAWECSLPSRIINAINQFQPSQRYHNEIGYHAELQGWLKREFPSAKVEVQTGASRPDIVIDNVAIEVKGPTDGLALKTLTDKCIRYLQYHQKLVIVLFEPQYTRTLYNEVAAGIERHFHGQAWLIEK